MNNEKETLELLLSQGFITYENPNKTWTMIKIQTPANFRLNYLVTVDGEIKPVFPLARNTREELYAIAERLLNTPEKDGFVVNGDFLLPQREYAIQVKWDDGVGPKFVRLENILANNPKDAQDLATKAASHRFGDKTEVKYFEARILPVEIANLEEMSR